MAPAGSPGAQRGAHAPGQGGREGGWSREKGTDEDEDARQSRARGHFGRQNVQGSEGRGSRWDSAWLWGPQKYKALEREARPRP